MKHLTQYFDFQKNLFSIFLLSYRHIHHLFWGKVVIIFQIFLVLSIPILILGVCSYFFGKYFQWDTLLANIPLLILTGAGSFLIALFVLSLVWYICTAAPIYLFYRLQNPNELRDMSVWNWSKYWNASLISARTSIILLLQILLLVVVLGIITFALKFTGLNFTVPLVIVGLLCGGVIILHWYINYLFVLPGFFLEWGDGTYSNTGIIQLSKKTVAGNKLRILGVFMPIILVFAGIDYLGFFAQSKHEEFRLTSIIQEQYQFQTGTKVQPMEFLMSYYTPEIQQVLETKEMENHESLQQYLSDIPQDVAATINTNLIARVYHLLDTKSLDTNWQWFQMVYGFISYLFFGFSTFGIQVALFQLKHHKYFKPKISVSDYEWHG